MSPETLSNFVGRSGQSEEELTSLWERLEEKWPVAFKVIVHGPPLDREEGTSWDGAVHDVIRETFPGLPAYPDHDNIYSDMKEVRGWQRVRAILETGQILDDQDFWVSCNTVNHHTEEWNAAQISRLQQLVSAYEKGS